MSFRVPEQHRITHGKLASTKAHGNNGAFMFALNTMLGTNRFIAIASDEGGWEHVSVSLQKRIPRWDEMCQIKAIFWEPEDAVMQLHPKESEYVDNHPFCLHLWRPTGEQAIPLPPSIMVGLKL